MAFYVTVQYSAMDEPLNPGMGPYESYDEALNDIQEPLDNALRSAAQLYKHVKRVDTIVNGEIRGVSVCASNTDEEIEDDIDTLFIATIENW